jgi:uncharacterized protein (UPF0548 family)
VFTLRTPDPDRYGFAYGTLPAHPEEGEELFLVTRGGDDTVRFEITAFSRPHDLGLGRLTDMSPKSHC